MTTHHSQQQDDRDEAADRWHVDKSISLPMVVGFCLQIIAATWYAAHQDARITDHDRRIVKLETLADDRGTLRDTQNTRISEAISEVKERMARMDASLAALARQQEREPQSRR